MFQHTAARRRLAKRREADDSPDSFNTQPPEGGWEHNYGFVAVGGVSTHSRPKAAGSTTISFRQPSRSFNTQPPEGGWQSSLKPAAIGQRFNTQPPEGGWG